MQFLLFASLLLAAPPAQDQVVRQLEVYTAEAEASPLPSETAGEWVVSPGSPARRAAFRGKARAAAPTPACPRRAYTAARAQYFTAPLDYKRQFDYPWHTTPSPSLPDMVRVVPGGIELIPAPPAE